MDLHRSHTQLRRHTQNTSTRKEMLAFQLPVYKLEFREKLLHKHGLLQQCWGSVELAFSVWRREITPFVVPRETLSICVDICFVHPTHCCSPVLHFLHPPMLILMHLVLMHSEPMERYRRYDDSVARQHIPLHPKCLSLSSLKLSLTPGELCIAVQCC